MIILILPLRDHTLCERALVFGKKTTKKPKQVNSSAGVSVVDGYECTSSPPPTNQSPPLEYVFRRHLLMHKIHLDPSMERSAAVREEPPPDADQVYVLLTDR